MARAVVLTMYRSDTATDNSPADAPRRAVRWMTRPQAKAVLAPRPSAGGAQWLRWNKHRAYATAERVQNVTEAGAPRDTSTTAIRQYSVQVTAHGRDDWRGQPTTRAVTLYLSRPSPSRPWRVARLEALN